MATVADLKERRTKRSKVEHPSNPDADPETQNRVVPDNPSGLTSLADVEDHVNALYFGEGGTGKTTHLLTLANIGPIVVINAEGGLKRRALERRGIDVSNVEVYGGPLTYDGLEELFWQLKARLANKDKPLVGVVWDSVTEINKVAIRNSIEDRLDKLERTGKGGSADPFQTDLSDYGRAAEQMRILIRRFRDLDCHFGASALEKRDKDDDGAVIYRPDLSPAVNRDMFGYTDIVCHTRLAETGDEVEYWGDFKPVGKYVAKDRFGALPRRLINPTYERMIAYVHDVFEEDEDSEMVAAKERRQAAAKDDPADGE